MNSVVNTAVPGTQHNLDPFSKADFTQFGRLCLHTHTRAHTHMRAYAHIHSCTPIFVGTFIDLNPYPARDPNPYITTNSLNSTLNRTKTQI